MIVVLWILDLPVWIPPGPTCLRFSKSAKASFQAPFFPSAWRAVPYEYVSRIKGGYEWIEEDEEETEEDIEEEEVEEEVEEEEDMDEEIDGENSNDRGEGKG